jgi:HD-like signal output (HDOD) protein
LWRHTTHVAALAGVLARRVTGVNPDTALFAGIIHEVGGFYLLSRADEFPGLLDDDPEKWGELCEDVVGMEVLKKLAVPGPVAGAIGELRRAWINMPPSTLLDTLLLANQYAAVASPLGRRAEPLPDHADSALDLVVDADMLAAIRAEAEEACRALGGPLLV